MEGFASAGSEVLVMGGGGFGAVLDAGPVLGSVHAAGWPVVISSVGLGCGRNDGGWRWLGCGSDFAVPWGRR